MEWSNEYSVNVRVLDDQHKRLFFLVDSLTKAMHEGKGNDIIQSVIDELTQYTVSHFKEEEAILVKINYPKTQYHIIEHKNFINKLNSFKQEVGTKHMGVSINVLGFLRDWLVNHILHKDKDYSNFMKMNNITL